MQQPFKSSDLEGCFYDLLQDGLKNGMSSVIINTMKSERKYRGMGFIDAYKRLEKLCGEILNDDRRISAYIDEMVNAPRGSYLVSGWDDDLKKLKHYRWIRNQIVHNPDCTEENMCDSNDTQWILKFYKRIMNQSDPISLYYSYKRNIVKFKNDNKIYKRKYGKLFFAFILILLFLLICIFVLCLSLAK